MGVNSAQVGGHKAPSDDGGIFGGHTIALKDGLDEATSLGGFNVDLCVFHGGDGCRGGMLGSS
jgi:hypothetical protein